MMSMIDLVALSMMILRIDIGFSLEKAFTQLIRMNPSIELYLILNHIDLCYGYLYNPFT